MRSASQVVWCFRHTALSVSNRFEEELLCMALERRLPGEDGAKEAEELRLSEGIDPPALRRQIEFYFSDSNLPRDSCALSSNTSASLLSERLSPRLQPLFSLCSPRGGSE